MTRSRFIRLLKEKGYVYKIEGDKIIITVARMDVSNTDDAHLAIRSIPPGVVFNNRGTVWMESLTSMSPGVEFNNGGWVELDSLTSLPSGTIFNNGRDVNLNSLTSISPGVVFKNQGGVKLRSLTLNYWFNKWTGNIEGIDSKRLLNFMISKGMFI